MSTEIKIPKLGISMTEAVLMEWLVSDGAAVEVGTPLYSMENDKAVQEVESPVAGVLRIIGSAGETFEVGHTVAIIE
jgi:pyruvate/2-oxoglutarate dehydrogenase complex dihydrolipoamide acyltransferase (E2) component